MIMSSLIRGTLLAAHTLDSNCGTEAVISSARAGRLLRHLLLRRRRRHERPGGGVRGVAGKGPRGVVVAGERGPPRLGRHLGVQRRIFSCASRSSSGAYVTTSALFAVASSAALAASISAWGGLAHEASARITASSTNGRISLIRGRVPFLKSGAFLLSRISAPAGAAKAAVSRGRNIKTARRTERDFVAKESAFCGSCQVIGRARARGIAAPRGFCV